MNFQVLVNFGDSMTHPGYYLFDGFYSTQRGVAEYTRLHRVDFTKLIQGKGIAEGTIVDLGCGNGNFLADLKQQFPKLKVYGVDKKRYSSRLNENEIVTGNVCDRIPQIKDGVADLVVSTTMTPWVNGDALEGLYVEANRILKEDGLGFIFPIGSNRVIENKGIGFINELGFDRSVALRQMKVPEWLDESIPAAVQVIFGDVDSIKGYLLP
jgi:SAM-dependent methyltransferase